MNWIEKIISFITKKEVYGLVLILLISYVAYHLLFYIATKIINAGKTPAERKKRLTIVKLFQNIIRYVIFVLAILFILDLYGVNTRSLIAGLGIAGAVIGLALQDTMKDFISGISIIMDNYFVVGDIVTFNNFTGEVIALGLKATKIKNVNGEVYTIANRNISEIINISQKEANVDILIPSAYEESIEQVEKTISKITKKIESLKDVTGCEYLGIEELGESAIHYSIRIHCSQDNQWAVKREALRIIKIEYDKDNIKIPYPQIEVHNGKKV